MQSLERPRKLRLAAIADDYTGASDLAGMLYAEGAKTLQTFGISQAPLPAGYDAIVVSLKTRSCPVESAQQQTREAMRQLAKLGPRQWQFKYCSTFDSTDAGNLGPVIDTMLDELRGSFTVAVPALPVNGRKQYLGHLFVNGQLLAESPLRHHPLNPMTDSNLVRHLQRQTKRRVGLVPLETVRAGEAAVREEFGRLNSGGTQIALVDAIDDHDLAVIGRACRGLGLVTGGSGIGAAIGRTWGRPKPAPLRDRPRTERTTLILSGSCSPQTLKQVERLKSAGFPILQLDPMKLDKLAALQKKARKLIADGGRVAIVSSAEPDKQTAAAGERIEAAFAELAASVPAEQVIAAGGETSGAVVQALGIEAVAITGVIDPGVPSLQSLGSRPLRLALKSGNFGSDDFFLSALEHLERT